MVVQVWGLNRDGIDTSPCCKIFISEIVEKEQHYISDSLNTLNERIIHSNTSTPTHERCRVRV